MSEITELSIAQQAAAIKARKISPVELAKAYLARIDTYNDKVNAFVTPTPEIALKEAKASEAAIMRGRWQGALHGIPIGHKDLYSTKGVRTTAGSRLLKRHVPKEDATVVARYKAAGTVLLGKLNTHEFAYGPTNAESCFGPSRNPWDLSRFTGGSSGGSGAAVALDLCAGATGSDTGGSIRIPSSACGITGIKPTYGRASRAGIFPLCWSMDHPGPMAHSVEDCAILLQPIVGQDPRDPTTVDRPIVDYRAALRGSIKGLKIGLPKHYFYSRALPAVEKAVLKAVDVLKSLGASVRVVNIPHIDHAAAAAVTMYLCEASAYHDDVIGTKGDAFTEQVRLFVELGNYVPAKDYLHAQRFRTLLGREIAEVLETVDVLALPTLPITALKLGQETIDIRGKQDAVFGSLIRNTEPFNLTGLPVVSVPCGFDGDGMPIGLSIAGRPFDEARILKVGHAYQRATDWHRRRPKL
jgi:aspartyl-tRNA(Asn)/glutamyl-tRNA(Gln) amidotransferase subunit A